MLQIGQVIDKKYKILNKIGQGGMSTVYLAMNERANKQWAIKEIRKDAVADAKVVRQSLLVEAEMLKELSHPCLPSIVDIIDFEDSILIVMDYIEGNTLSKAIIEYGAQPQDYVIEWAKQMCDVLEYLHSQTPPIIYRDFKPGNIMLKPNGTIVLIDFGAAREFKNDNYQDTTCLGTRGFAAPEQFEGDGQTDIRTDIYGLGTTIYNLVTGKNPSEPPYEIYPIRYWDESLSQGLEKIILKCTQADPDKRYQNCAEVLYDLEHYYELDENYRRKEKWKLISFFVVFLLSIICGVGSLFCHLTAKGIQNNLYQTLLEEATRTQTMQDKSSVYLESIKIDPTRAEGYIDLVENVYLLDGVFSEEESLEIRQLLLTSYGNKTYEDLLKQDNANYSLFAYKLGLAYFYNFEGNGNKQQSAYWFHKAVDGELNESQKLRAMKLGCIAEYYINLSIEDKTGDKNVNYKEYWDDLVSVTDGNITEIDNATTALVIYKEMASQICVNVNQFKMAQVSLDDMEAQLRNIETHIAEDINGTEAENSNRVVKLEAEVQSNIEKARIALEMAYK